MSQTKGSSPVSTGFTGEAFQAGYTKRSWYMSFTSTSKKSNLLDSETSLVELFATQDCWVSIISNSATQNTPPAAENVVVENIKRVRGGLRDFIGVPPELENPVVAVIYDGIAGTLDVTELA